MKLDLQYIFTTEAVRKTPLNQTIKYQTVNHPAWEYGHLTLSLLKYAMGFFRDSNEKAAGKGRAEKTCDEKGIGLQFEMEP